MTFQVETVEESADAILALSEGHNDEVGWGRDLDIQVQVYQALERAGMLLLFTARTEAWALAGYAVFSVGPHTHYGTNVATQDALYMVPGHRGAGGLAFMRWQERVLREAGVSAILRAVTPRHDHGRLLERLGYDEVGRTFLRRLDEVRQT